MTREIPKPNCQQYSAARAVTVWYLDTYYGTPEDVGVSSMFCREDCVGHFAVDAKGLSTGDGDMLFRLLVTMTMFQKRSDRQIMRVLQGIAKRDAREMTDAAVLLELSDTLDCPNAGDLSLLKERCDLAKDLESKRGICNAYPNTHCHMKRHTELLKRYGHFGKMPTSAALAMRTNGVMSLVELKDRIWKDTECPIERSIALEQAISRSWRVSKKIASMFLSAVTNQDLSGDLAPWSQGADTNHFVVIDSNVDLFLKATGYAGPKSYEARREFIQSLAMRVPLDKYRPTMRRYNPRIVQQALYMFMSESNRRASDSDCSHTFPPVCLTCSSTLLPICPRYKVSSA